MKKVVLKLDVHDDKEKQRAMKSVSRLSGIDSISIDIKEKKLTVIGDIDPVTLHGKLKKVCHTEILTVGPSKEPEKKKDEPKKDEVAQVVKAYQAYCQTPPMFAYHNYCPVQVEDPIGCVIC